MIQPTSAEAIAAGLTEAQREAWDCGVVHGQPSWISDIPARFSCSQYKPDDGEPQHITLGLFLGDHKWAMGNFTPEEAAICAALILSKPAVRSILERNPQS
jgi:hypothetical protein